MYQTVNIIVKQSDSKLFDYCKMSCQLAKLMRNTVIFRCRQILFADQKDVSMLQTNQLQVLNEFGLLALKQKGDKLYLPNYNAFDSMFKQTNNKDYYNALPMQTSQQIIKAVLADFKSYFKAVKQFSLHPDKFTGKPKIPNYVKADESEFDITNQDAVIKTNGNGTKYLKLPKTKATVTLPDYITGRLKEVTIRPFYDTYKISIVTEVDDTKMIPFNNRIIGLDLGVNNFVTTNNNCGLTPFIINGKTLKSFNQWYNKELAYLRSCAMKNGCYSSKRIQKLNRKHYCVTNDFYNKVASYIVKYCISNNISVIVVGKNDGWKQNINLTKQNNQEFCFLSHAYFIKKLTLMAKRFGIETITTEESYTSKASLLSMDTLPAFQKSADTAYTFSGKRIKRGLYKDETGACINADVNGAGNIIRKVFQNAFDTVTDFTYMYQTTLKVKIV